MRKKIKIIFLVFVFIVPVFIVSILVINKAKRLPITSKKIPFPVPPHRHPGKENMLAKLKAEDLDQSIALLFDDAQQYFFPYINRQIGPDVQDNIKQLLSSRRSIKILQEIKALRKFDGKAKCELLFSKAFQQHTNACRILINWSLNTNAPPHGQNLLGSRMALSAALFFTAESTNLDILEKQFVQLNQWRNEIEPIAQLPNLRIQSIPALFDSTITPDYCLQVNVLRLAALRSGNADGLKEIDEACAAIKMKSYEIPIVAWNAKTTAFEVLPDSPLDTSMGVTTYTFYEWSDEMALKHANFLNSNYGNRLLSADEEKLFVKKIESLVFHQK